jgi:tetratricopeptide (TPR) repeat protein
MSIKISFSKDEGFIISGSPVGTSSGSDKNDFYVYEWFIKETGEIFYVGKGRGKRYQAFHDRAYDAEKIRSMYETGTRFVGENLTEDEAIELEDAEMMRILNDTNDRLTNRITPLFADRDNGYGRSPDTPTLEFEKAPVLYASEIENHYYGIKWRAFDEPLLENLDGAFFIQKGISQDVLGIVYGGDIERYRSETVALLKASGKKILKSKFAKSIGSWIYIDDDYVTNVDIAQERAQNELNRRIPVYHILNVWKALKDAYGDTEIKTDSPVELHPVNTRVPLVQILHVDSSIGFDNGYPLWEKADSLQKAGSLNESLDCLDQARYQGYDAPVLYSTYAKIYRKLKDYDNEIDILQEAIYRYSQSEFGGSSAKLIWVRERLDKSIELKRKQMK